MMEEETLLGVIKYTEDGTNWKEYGFGPFVKATIKQLLQYVPWSNVLAIAEPLGKDEPISTEKKGVDEKCQTDTHGIAAAAVEPSPTSPAPEVTKGANTFWAQCPYCGKTCNTNIKEPMNPQPVAPGPASIEYTAYEIRCAWIEWAKTQSSPKPSWIVPWHELDEQSKDADRALARWHLSKFLPPPWQRISENCLPDANKPFFAWSANQETMFTYTNGINYPTSLIQNNFTHWMPCEGIYQIPPPPVEETKPAWEVWFNEESKKVTFDSLSDEILSRGFVSAALRAAAKDKRLLEGL